jgi:two-component system phosphate regulon response regulator PhoB
MRRKRVLVVEDDQPLRHVYRTALAMVGFDVDTAEDGLGALVKIAEQPPDLIVLDLQLPRIDGRAVLHEVQAGPTTAAIPIIVVTGSDADCAFDHVTVLRKPCEPEALVQAVSRHVGEVSIGGR